MVALEAGSDDWWRAKKGPEWTPESGGYRVTFWWRDTAGTEVTSNVSRVWVYITGVTDHHQNATPQSLTRVPGTDVWQWQTLLSSTWRGSYCFIPSERDDDFPAAAFADAGPDPQALREGWRKLLPRAVADPLNHQSWKGGRGHAVSALEMPEAVVQPGWQAQNTSFPPARCIAWCSQRLGNTRRVWVFTTGDAQPKERPLALLLDGQFWAESMPVWSALTDLTDKGKLPPAVYVLIDVIDTAHRSKELPCNPDFWHAVQDELLPMIHAQTPFSDRPEYTLVAGQSFGGLAAMYAGLHWPDRFGCVLSQSGSYWWPNRGNHLLGEIPRQLASGELTPPSLRIVLEAGAREPIIFRANQTLFSLLQPSQRSLTWREVDGGHDALCWRGGLTAGLINLWQPLIAPDDSHD